MHLSIILGVYIHRATNQPTNQPIRVVNISKLQQDGHLGVVFCCSVHIINYSNDT